MKRSVGWSMLILTLAGCGSWGEQALVRRQTAEIYVRKGVGYMEEGRYEQARGDLERALELNCDNSEAHNAMAVLYERLDKPDESRHHYQRAVSLDGRNYGALNNYSRFLCHHGEYAEGLELLNRVIDSKLYSQPWLVLTNKGICYKSAGRLEEAEASLREALESQPDFAPALLERARLSFVGKNYMQARAFLQRYAGAAPHTAETLWLAVQTEDALGNQAAIRGYQEQLLRRFPDSPEAIQMIEVGRRKTEVGRRNSDDR